MSSAVEVILLERVDNLGDLGETVRVKPGFARNYLFPQQKALRATKSNIAYFEAQKKEIEKRNASNRKEAETKAKALEGLTITMVRHASESGQLYGSVTSRDIADAVNESAKEKIGRGMVEMNTAYKMIGLFPVTISLHPEVKIEMTINIARSEDEAKIQAKTGKALITTHEQEEEVSEAPANENSADTVKEEFLEDSALEAEKVQEAEDAAEAEKEAEKAAQKAAKKAEKEAAAEAEEAETEGEAEEAAAEKDAE